MYLLFEIGISIKFSFCDSLISLSARSSGIGTIPNLDNLLTTDLLMSLYALTSIVSHPFLPHSRLFSPIGSKLFLRKTVTICVVDVDIIIGVVAVVVSAVVVSAVVVCAVVVDSVVVVVLVDVVSEVAVTVVVATVLASTTTGMMYGTG